MDKALRKEIIENLKMKIAACQGECSALVRKLSSPDLTQEERAKISNLQDQSMAECHNLRNMLNLHEHED